MRRFVTIQSSANGFLAELFGHIYTSRDALKRAIDRLWRGAVTFSVYKSAEGGCGLAAIYVLADAGIPARRAYSPYVGQVGIQVPRRFAKKAERILY